MYFPMIDYNTLTPEILPLLEKWYQKLDLKVKNSIGVCYTNGDNLPKIHWDEKNEKYIIRINIDHSEFSIVHELGHIWLGQIYNDMDLTKGNKYRFESHIKDFFVDYNLTRKFQEYYNHLKNYLLYICKHYIKEGFTYSEYLNVYLIQYIYFNYILTPNDKKKLLPYSKAFLKDLRTHIIKENPNFTYKAFQTLDNLLNRFGKIRAIKDSKLLYEYRNAILHFINSIA